MQMSISKYEHWMISNCVICITVGRLYILYRLLSIGVYLFRNSFNFCIFIYLFIFFLSIFLSKFFLKQNVKGLLTS